VSPTDPLWTIHAADGAKGLGVFAARAIKKGELIISERPLYFGKIGRCAFDETEQNGIFERNMLKPLAQSSLLSILGLRNAHASENPYNYDEVVGILKTNCLPIQVSDVTGIEDKYGEDLHEALFPYISRINHSCSPSTHFYFNTTTFCGELRATRNITKGAELSWTYTDLFASRAERRQYLKEHFRFHCACESCSQDEADIRESDRRREALAVFTKHGPNSTQTTNHLRTLHQFAVREKLDGVQPGLMHALATQSRIKDRDLEASRRWLFHSHEGYKVLQGERNERVKADEKILKSLQKLQKLALD
jgi:hypothetical protein